MCVVSHGPSPPPSQANRCHQRQTIRYRGPVPTPPPPPQVDHNSLPFSVPTDVCRCGIQVPRLHITPGDLCIGGGRCREKCNLKPLRPQSLLCPLTCTGAGSVWAVEGGGIGNMALGVVWGASLLRPGRNFAPNLLKAGGGRNWSGVEPSLSPQPRLPHGLPWGGGGAEFCLREVGGAVGGGEPPPPPSGDPELLEALKKIFGLN